MKNYTTNKGWTVARMKEQITKYNNGTRAGTPDELNPTNPDLFQCKYQDSGGNRCAVGCFIPDNELAALTYWGDVRGLLSRYTSLEHVMPLNLAGLADLQKVHDGWPSASICGEAKTLHEAIFNWLDANVEDFQEAADT